MLERMSDLWLDRAFYLTALKLDPKDVEVIVRSLESSEFFYSTLGLSKSQTEMRAELKSMLGKLGIQ